MTQPCLLAPNLRSQPQCSHPQYGLKDREDEHTRARLGAWALTVPTSPGLLQLQTGT